MDNNKPTIININLTKERIRQVQPSRQPRVVRIAILYIVLVSLAIIYKWGRVLFQPNTHPTSVLPLKEPEKLGLNIEQLGFEPREWNMNA